MIRGAGEVSWRPDYRVREAGAGNGEPGARNHGIVTGVSGRLVARGPPAAERTSLEFYRKVKTADNAVRLRVERGERQTLLVAWGDDGQEQITYHGPERRGARTGAVQQRASAAERLTLAVGAYL